MKVSRKLAGASSRRMLNLLLIGGIAAIPLISALAQNVPGEKPAPPKEPCENECKECGDEEDDPCKKKKEEDPPVEPPCQGIASMSWGMKLGRARYLHPDDLKALAAAGYQYGTTRGAIQKASVRFASAAGGGGGSGGSGGGGDFRGAGLGSGSGAGSRGGLDQFDDFIARYLNRGVLNRSEVMLEINVPSIRHVKRKALYINGTPHCRIVRGYSSSEEPFGGRLAVAESGGAGGVVEPIPGPIRQVISDDIFADVADLPDDGFRIRAWRLPVGFTLVPGEGGEGYAPPTGEPIQEVIFEFLPVEEGSQATKLKVLKKENFGTGAWRSETDLYVENGDFITRSTFAGDATEGAEIRKTVVRHFDHGERIWDYSIEREVYEAATDAAGFTGALVKVAHTKEVYGDFSPMDFTRGGSPGFAMLDSTQVIKDKGGKDGARRLLEITQEYGARNLKTSYTYETDKLKDNYGALKSVVRHDGSWEVIEYGISADSPVAAIASYKSWANVSKANYKDGLKTETLVMHSGVERVVSVQGQVISKTKAFKYTVAEGKTRFLIETFDGIDWRKKEYRFIGPTGDHGGRPEMTFHEDGTLTTYSYHQPAAGLLTVTEKTGAIGPDGESVVSGIETRTTYNECYQIIAEEKYDVESGLFVYSRTGDEFDNLGRPSKWTFNGDEDDYEIIRRSCCGVEFERSRNGATTTYYRDALRRVCRREDQASVASPVISTFIVHHGRTTSTTRSDGTTTMLVSEITDDFAGDPVEVKSPDEDGDGNPEITLAETRFPGEAGHPGSAGAVRYITNPDGSTIVTANYLDGRVKSVTGTAVPDVFHEYDTHTEQGGGTWTKTFHGSATSAEWTQRWFNIADEEFRIGYPDGATVLKGRYSPAAPGGSRGKIAAVTDADGVTTAYQYDAEGEIAIVTEAMPGGQERVTTTDIDVVNDPQLATAWRTRKWINGVLVSTEYVSADGRATRSESLGVTTAWSQTLPADGAWTTTTTTGDGQKLIKTYAEGRLARSEFFDSQDQSVSWTSWTYDPFGRLLTETDSRTGTATRGAYTDSGNLLASTDAGGRATAWGYDVMGRTVLIDQPDTTDANGDPVENITRTAYHLSGEIQAVWGDQTNPTYRVYDEQNRLTQLRTYRGIAHGIRPLAGTGGYDPTTWTYDSQRGWLVSKRDAAGKGADYAYTPGGRLLTREWARTLPSTARLTTTYGYDAGKLVTTSYNDGVTPGVSYAYDAFGRQTQVTQAGNSWTYTYDPATLLLDTETVTYDTDNDGTGDFTRILDRSHDVRLRPTGYQLKDGATVEAAAAYTYDDSGRLHTVGDGTDTFTYTYETGSHLVKTVAGPVHTVTNTWDATRDALLVKENKVGATVVSKYEYGVNAIGQRSTLAASGSAFSAARSIGWAYNARGEVTSAAHSDTAQSRFYQYDPIGNRQKSRTGAATDSGGTLTSYVSNSLNQYTSVNASTPVHDVDGNTLQTTIAGSGGIQTGDFGWDAENRLLEVQAGGSTVGAYRYDPFGRRISKTAAGATSLFLYDGWNPVAEYHLNTGSWKLKTSLLFGQDLSGSMQGAGGVGGLLSTTDHEASPVERFHPTYDGNGNVSEYLDESGAAAVHFEYDPFGQVTVSTDATNRFPVRFSTKWQDFESGLNYYGYRYYDPQQGRWLNRDPASELGSSIYFARRIRLENALNILEREIIAITNRGGDRELSNDLIATFEVLRTHHVIEILNGDLFLGSWMYSYVSNDSLNSVDVWGLEDLRLFNAADEKRMQHYDDGDDTFDIGAHGNPDAIFDKDGTPLTPEELLDKIIDDPRYKKAKKIKLWACETGKGKDSFAERLAKLTGKPTSAPNEIFWDGKGKKGTVLPKADPSDPNSGPSKNPFKRIAARWRNFKP